jgi:hypothetical protein
VQNQAHAVSIAVRSGLLPANQLAPRSRVI